MFGTIWASLGMSAYFMALTWINILLGLFLSPLFMIPLSWLRSKQGGQPEADAAKLTPALGAARDTKTPVARRPGSSCISVSSALSSGVPAAAPTTASLRRAPGPAPP